MERQASKGSGNVSDRSVGSNVYSSEKETSSVADEATMTALPVLGSEAIGASRRPGRASAQQAPIPRRPASLSSRASGAISRVELIRAIVEQSTAPVARTSETSGRRTSGRRLSSRERRQSGASMSSYGSMTSSKCTRSQMFEDDASYLEVVEASRRMATLQTYMQLWQVQLIFFGASLAHCACYLFGPGQDCTWLEATGGLVIGLTLLELLVQVAAQAGWPWWPSAWRRFLLPLFHVAEILVAAALIARCGWAMHICPITTADDRADVGFDRPSLAVVLYHRAMRAWAIFYGVSVQSTQKHRHYQDCKKQAWWQDWQEEKRKETKRLSFRIAGFLGDLRAQFCILLMVVAHCGLYTAWGVTKSKVALAFSEPTGYLTFGVLASEFIVRCSAQGGEQFLTPALHKVEVVFLGAASFVLLYPALYNAWIAEGRGGWQPGSFKVWLVLIIHRTVRFLATQHDLSAREWGLHSVLEAKAFKVFLSMFGDLLEVSPQNVHISLPSPTQKDIKVRIVKAKLKTEAFRGLHLPIAVRGGLVEALDITLPRPLRGERHEDLVTRLTLKNLLLLAGPGGGLGEAGFGVSSRYWVSDNVVETKSKLVELICQKLSVFGYAQSTDADEKRDSGSSSRVFEHTRNEQSRRRCVNISGVPSWGERARLQFEMRLRAKLDSMKEKFTNLAQELALNHVEVSISNVRLEYEDLGEGLGYNHAMIGLRVGDVFIRRLLEQRLTITASRLGVSVDVSRNNAQKALSGLSARQPQTLSKSSSNISRRKHTARGLCRIIGEHPQTVMDQMNVLNIGEKLRLCAFEALDPEPLEVIDEPLSESARPLSDWQRHRRCERWPERHLVISLLRVSLQAGPSDGNGNWISEDAGTRPKRNARVSLWGRSGKARKRKQKPWLYRAHLTPLRLTIDDEQASYLQILLSCLQSWFLHNESFRWRPDFMPLSPALCTEELRQERSTIVRLWWMYALHRVLARLHKQPHVPTGLQVSWHLANVSRYRDLMVEVAHRPGAEVSQLASESWSWSEWEKAWAKELQMRLSLTDIIECRRSGLASRSLGDPEERKDPNLGVREKLAEMKNKIAQMNMEQLAEVQQRAMEAAENWQDRMEGTVQAAGERMEVVQELARNQVLDVLEVLDTTAKTAPARTYSSIRKTYGSIRKTRRSGQSTFIDASPTSKARQSEARATIRSSKQSETPDRPSLEGSHDGDTKVLAVADQEHGEPSDTSSESHTEVGEHALPDTLENDRKSNAKVSRVSKFTTSSVAASSAATSRFTRAGTQLSLASAFTRADSFKSAVSQPGDGAATVAQHRSEGSAGETGSGKATFGMHNAAGSWQVTMSGAEVRILRRTPTTSNARAVLLHIKWWEITLDACILPPKVPPKPADGEASCATPALKPYTAAISVCSFAVTCPDADELLLGSGREIVRVTKPVELPAAKPEHLEGTCTGQRLAFAARVGVTKSSEGELSNDIEVYCSDMFVVLSAPLLLALQNYASVDLHKQPQQISQPSVVLDTAADNERWQPPTSCRAEDNPGRASVKEQRQFEMLTGIRGIFLNWCVEVNIGCCQILQVSQYSKANMLVEEYRVWPFSTSTTQGERENEEDTRRTTRSTARPVMSRFSSFSSTCDEPSTKGDRWITMESKGLESIKLLPWSAPDWLIEDKLDERTYHISCKGKLSGTASDKEKNAPYLQVHLKGGVSSVSGGPTSSLCCFASHNDWRVVHPCCANLGNETGNLASDDLQMPLRFCGATASCSCMISARAPVFVHGHSSQAPQASLRSSATVASNLSEDSETSSTVGDLPELLPSTTYIQKALMWHPEKWSGCGKPWCSARAQSREAESDAEELPNRSSEWNALRSIACAATDVPAPAAAGAPILDVTSRTGVEMRFHILPCTGFGRSWLEHLAKRWYDEVYPPRSMSEGAKPTLHRSVLMDFEGGSSRQSQPAPPALLRPSRRRSQGDVGMMPMPLPDSHDAEVDEDG